VEFLATLALLVALTTGLGSFLSFWRQAVYPGDPPKWLGYVFLGLAAVYGGAIGVVLITLGGVHYMVPNLQSSPVAMTLFTVLGIAAAAAWVGDRRGWVKLPWKRRHIPLEEAATQAYEQTRGTALAKAAERSDKGVLTWYSWVLWRRLRLYGLRPPSRVPEEIPRKDQSAYAFEMEGAKIVLRSRYDEGHFEKMYVLAAELPKALSEIGAVAGPHH
jgi:hypothetical protein